MDAQPRVWKAWVDQIRKWGLGEFAATFLEATEPLNLIAAQFIYLGQPLFKSTVAEKQMVALAHILEDPDETSSFAAQLRESN